VHCLGVLSINIGRGAIFTPVKPAKPGYEIAVRSRLPAGKPAEAGKSREPIEQAASQGRRRPRREKRPRNAWPATTRRHGRAQPGRPQPLWSGTGRPKARRRDFNYSAR